MTTEPARKRRWWSDSTNWGCIGMIAYLVLPIIIFLVLGAVGVWGDGDGNGDGGSDDGLPEQCWDARGSYPC